MMETIAVYAVVFWLLVGAGFTLVGAIGLLKFNDSMTRLHAPTKVGTIGIGSLLMASMIHSYVFGDGAMHEVLIMAFLFVTAPISANFMAKVNIHVRSCDTPPDLPTGEDWATLDRPDGYETIPDTTDKPLKTL
ncbi:monovalent cation/H(+) antiporter subunit G [Sulfitobacter sp. S190]|uniref:cation:proton antiporter n=1 Tax=Sulfitobacter sp. S190 TaxID=2867022 RepID=UPI0021A4AE49|nr:monovalent cation/H(+) antiporter subunit G [Sulfitobacter sp. S190]UWR21589.1 monovalent cation/H(+) antiporter subunit G [Sulfitobacter sp. S190]